MNTQNFLKQMIGIASIVLLLVGCASPTPSASPTSPPLLAGTPFPTVPVSPLPTVQVAGKVPVVQLTTKLGVDTVVEVSYISIDDETLSYARNKYTDAVLNIADGVYVLFPLKNLRRAYERDTVHVVTLADGRELRGKLVGVINTPDRKEYDLGTAASVILTSFPQEEPTPIPTVPPALWQAQFVKPTDFNGTVYNPRFVFQYWSGAGYVFGGSDCETRSTSFHVKVREEEILAQIEDFEEISFAEWLTGTPEPSTQSQIKVRAKSGIETVGALVLKEQDSKGYHTAHKWFLVMDLADEELIIVLKDPIGNLRQVTR